MTQPPDNVDSCFACDLTSGAVPLPGGIIHRTSGWLVEHCVGPLGVGTLVVKPARHVTHVADLTGEEAAELGPLLRQATSIVTKLTEPDQVYVCLWSHADRQPGHIHFVVQPVDAALIQRYDAHGPALQLAMFRANESPPPVEVEAFARQAADLFTRLSGV
jgi:diadenosine tetraphosphate (Ap4A) HIT family hydrolase